MYACINVLKKSMYFQHILYLLGVINILVMVMLVICMYIIYTYINIYIYILCVYIYTCIVICSNILNIILKTYNRNIIIYIFVKGKQNQLLWNGILLLRSI